MLTSGDLTEWQNILEDTSGFLGGLPHNLLQDIAAHIAPNPGEWKFCVMLFPIVHSPKQILGSLCEA